MYLYLFFLPQIALFVYKGFFNSFFYITFCILFKCDWRIGGVSFLSWKSHCCYGRLERSWLKPGVDEYNLVLSCLTLSSTGVSWNKCLSQNFEDRNSSKTYAPAGTTELLSHAQTVHFHGFWLNSVHFSSFQSQMISLLTLEQTFGSRSHRTLAYLLKTIVFWNRSQNCTSVQTNIKPQFR